MVLRLLVLLLVHPSSSQPLQQETAAPSLMRIGGSLVLSKLQADSDLEIFDNGRTVVAAFDTNTANNACTISKRECSDDFLARHRNELSLVEAPFVADSVAFKTRIDEYDCGDENDRSTSIITQIIGTGTPPLKVGIRLSGTDGMEVLAVDDAELLDFDPRGELAVAYSFDRDAQTGAVSIGQEGRVHTERFKFTRGDDLKIGTYSGTSKARRLKVEYTDIAVVKVGPLASARTTTCGGYTCSGKWAARADVAGDESCCAGGKADCGGTTPCYRRCCSKRS